MVLSMGVYLVAIVLGTICIVWSVAHRARFRRQQETPYRGKKLTSGEWRESCDEALARTPFVMVFYSMVMCVLFGSFYALGVLTDDIEQCILQVERAMAAEPEVQEREPQEEDELSRMIRCHAAIEALPDPTVHLGAYWNDLEPQRISFGRRYVTRQWDGHNCGYLSRQPLLKMSAEALVNGLNTISVVRADRSFNFGGWTGYEQRFLDLVRERNRDDDHTALAERLYGRQGRFLDILAEGRRLYLVMTALNEAQADSPEIREALKFMTQYRLGDNSLPVVTLRDMARQMMASRQLNDSADTSNNNGS